MTTAFQPNAFQNNAFQIGAQSPVITPVNWIVAPKRVMWITAPSPHDPSDPNSP